MNFAQARPRELHDTLANIMSLLGVMTKRAGLS